MNRAETAAEVEKIERKCAGPLLLTNEQKDKGYRKVRAFIAGGDAGGLVAYVTGIDKVLQRIPPRFYEMLSTQGDGKPAGDLELDDLMEGAGRVLEARQPCGELVNGLILAEPFDGRDHVAPCPKCGTPQEWTAPLADEDAAARVASDAAALAAALDG